MAVLSAPQESTLTAIMRAIGRGVRHLRVRRTAVLGALVFLSRLLLTISALTMFSIAAFSWSHIAGYVVIGAGLLVLEWVVKDAPRRDRR
jgi:hypothetical protein